MDGLDHQTHPASVSPDPKLEQTSVTNINFIIIPILPKFMLDFTQFINKIMSYFKTICNMNIIIQTYSHSSVLSYNLYCHFISGPNCYKISKIYSQKCFRVVLFWLSVCPVGDGLQIEYFLPPQSQAGGATHNIYRAL